MCLHNKRSSQTRNSRHVVVRPFLFFSNARKILCSRLGLKSRYHSAKSRNASQFTTPLNRHFMHSQSDRKRLKGKAISCKIYEIFYWTFHCQFGSFHEYIVEEFSKDVKEHARSFFYSRARKAPLVVCVMEKFISRALKNEFQSLDVLVISRSPTADTLLSDVMNVF